jgi:hypothetical protein
MTACVRWGSWSLALRSLGRLTSAVFDLVTFFYRLDFNAINLAVLVFVNGNLIFINLRALAGLALLHDALRLFSDLLSLNFSFLSFLITLSVACR